MIKIILSALNEAQNLTDLLPKINLALLNLKREYQIVLCLDGTNDNSYQVINDLKKTAPIYVLDSKNQLGLGVAFKRLFLDVIKNSHDNDIIISLDADNTHDPGQFTQIIQHFEQYNLDLLVVSRFCRNSIVTGFPLYRRMISRATSIALQIIFAVKKLDNKNLKDYSSGYRAYKVKALKDLYIKYGENFIVEKDFIYTCEILIKLAKIGKKLDEISLNYDYAKKIGASKLKILKNARALFFLILNNWGK